MGNGTVLTSPTTAGLHQLAETSVSRVRSSAAATNTIRAYNRQWNRFVGWCRQAGLAPCPADARTVSLFLTTLDEAGLSVATMAQALAAITKVHRNANRPVPMGRALDETWSGIRRTRGIAPRRRVKAIDVKELSRMVKALAGDRLIDRRDRALLLLGFAGTFRRSELAGLRCEDLVFRNAGLGVCLRRSETSLGETKRRVAIPETIGFGLYPARALGLWLRSSGVVDGAVFRAIDRHGNVSWYPISGRSIARIVKRAAERAGLDSWGMSVQSFRRGSAVSAS